MTSFKEGPHAAQFVLSEANGERSRENVTINASQTLLPGSVISGDDTAGYGLITATPGAKTGVALYAATTGVGVTTKISAIMRDAEVNGKAMAWPSGTTLAQVNAAVAELAKQGIVVRGLPDTPVAMEADAQAADKAAEQPPKAPVHEQAADDKTRRHR